MSDRTLGGPMSKCPVCGRTGLVGKEHEIVGRRAVTVYKCHGCDNSWRVRDEDVTPVEPAPPAPRAAAARPARGAGKRSATPRLAILSISRAEQYQPHGTEVCISITEPRAAPARLSPAFKDVLRVSFTDITAPTGLDSHVLFAAEHAKKILDFIDRWSDRVDAVVVHCVGGFSRSPAVGMALCELKGWPLGRMEADHPMWNKWVRSELVRLGRERKKAKPASGRKRDPDRRGDADLS